MKTGVKALIVIILLIGLTAILWLEVKNFNKIRLVERKVAQHEAALKNISKQLATLAEPKSTSPVQSETAIQQIQQTAPPQQQLERTDENLHVFVGSVNEKGLCEAFSELAEKGDILCAHVSRILHWKLDLTRSLMRGDKIKVLYRWQKDEKEPTILAIDFSGTKKVQAYRFKLSDDKFPSYFDEQGVEIPARIENSPINDYEQITAFFNEHRGWSPRHKGIDFKAPVGTPVHAPFSGVVTRHNWNWRANGNCLEIKVDGQNLYVIFLHLNEELVTVGQRVEKGQLVAKSGNTGKTTAPHLHYQLERDMNGTRKPLDPLKLHRLYHRRLEGAELEAFKVEVANLKSFLQSNP